MRQLMHSAVIGGLWLVAVEAQILGQVVGPFDPENWPDTADASKKVHYVVTDAGLAPPSDTWLKGGLAILSGGDQVTEPIAIGGHDGLKVTGNYLNVRDATFDEWADDEVIDILVQVYGDAALLGAGDNPRNFVFLTGILPELSFPSGGSIPVECKNRQWNWILFRISNNLRASDGTHFVGSIPANAQGDFQSGGVNGGTIRFEGVPLLTVRVVAFGEEGAFGEPDAINVCFEAPICAPEPLTNLVSVDVNTSTAEHLEVLNNVDQTVTFQDGVGPAGDLRRAARPSGSYMNFGISGNYLGEPCNDPRAMKMCVEYYDDPLLAGASFGPEAFATDSLGGIGVFPAGRWEVLAGSNLWARRSWTVPGVNLKGVNTAPLTGGPRLAFEGGAIFISKVEMAVLRTGAHPLADQDPLSNCFEDPKICTDAYGNYAELDLGRGIENGLAPGTSGGDQEMIIAEAGPAGDRRQAIRPAFDDGTPGFAHQYLNLALVNEPFGPSSQPNAQLAICVTYYDDPALTGTTFRPEVYQVDRGGVATFGFFQGASVILEGTDQWRDAYFEISEIKFLGVNQGPQAAARFSMIGKIFFTRVRYAVIRPCGPRAGVNLLQECKLPPGTRVSVDLGDIDLEDGLMNTVRDDPSDGENAFLVCGPADDLREGRSNYGNADPTPDNPDPNFYFTVTDPAMKAGAMFRLEVTAYDDPLRTGAGLYLQYTNADSTGPGDIPNTFFPNANPPTNTLGGSGKWVVLTWEIKNAGFRSFQQGAADFRLGVTDGGSVCLDKVELVFTGLAPPAPPAGLVPTAGDRQVALDWTDNTEPDLQGYNVYRATVDGGPYARIAELVATSAHTDTGLTNGTPYYYVVRAVNPAGESPNSAQVTAIPMAPAPAFRRGDLDDSGAVDISDAINGLHNLFLGDFVITCQDAADFDDSGEVDISDMINSLLWQFASGSIAPDPGPFNCGPDPTPDKDAQGNPADLGCVLHTQC